MQKWEYLKTYSEVSTYENDNRGIFNGYESFDETMKRTSFLEAPDGRQGMKVELLMEWEKNQHFDGLNNLGDEGWELCSVEIFPYSYSLEGSGFYERRIFKRQKD